MQAQYTNEAEVEGGTRSRILQILHEWVTMGGGNADLLDDGEFYAAWNLFLAGVETSPSNVRQEESLTSTAAALREHTKSLLEFPNQLRSVPPPSPNQGSKFGLSPPDLDNLDIIDFVDNLDEIATFFMSQVSETDVTTAADVLEVQLMDRCLVPVYTPLFTDTSSTSTSAFALV